ncbi:MAG: hypothetical protein ABIA75_11725 [Candidatus Neomarinimicrobiota bacterium]
MKNCKHTTLLSWGAVLTTGGAAGIVISTISGGSGLADPWGSILAFIFGLACGSGIVLAVAGLIGRRADNA